MQNIEVRTRNHTTTSKYSRLRLARGMAVLCLAGGFLLTPQADAKQCQAHTNVCEQEYALCIAASCMNSPEFPHALCVCDVMSGWSVGPGTCDDRKVVDHGNYKKLISTFSPALYDSKPFYKGSGLNADCYGATCFSTDGESAVCLCPTSSTLDGYWTEAGSCSPPGENIVYSGAPSPFQGGQLAKLTQMIATCSGEIAPTPTKCPSQ